MRRPAMLAATLSGASAADAVEALTVDDVLPDALARFQADDDPERAHAAYDAARAAVAAHPAAIAWAETRRRWTAVDSRLVNLGVKTAAAVRGASAPMALEATP